MMEDSIIENIKKEVKLRKKGRIPVPIGDDCTYLEEQGKKYLVISVDSMTEDVHFKLDWLPFYFIGYRAMAAALSDLAAKDATPIMALVDLHIPQYIDEKAIKEIYKGMEALSNRFSVAISGGNISKDVRLSLSITVIGEKDTLPPLRNGAQEGDYIYITGTLGLPLLFVKLKKKGADFIPEKIQSKFFKPLPRFDAAHFILTNYKVTSIMDISDGLGKDAWRLAKESKRTFFLYESLIPVNKIVRTYVSEPILFALSSGEEYELLFTSPNYIREKGIYRVGIVKGSGEGVNLVKNDGKVIDISSFGFDHLEQESPLTP